MQREDMKRTFKLRTHEEALSQLMKALRTEPLRREEVAVEEAVGRVLAADIVSSVDVPEVSHAVFDGYAVRSEDIRGASLDKPLVLRVVGRSFPGDEGSRLSKGETVYTACGAPIPEGADAVLKVETTRLLGERIEVCFPAELGLNVAKAGEDVKSGKTVLRAGHLLRPQDAGLLAGIGLKHVEVFRRPRVAIISVGNELVALSEREPGRIANNYALTVSGLVAEFGGVPQRFGIVPDDLEEIKGRVSEALTEADIVATIAGCSVGPRDLVPDAISDLGRPGIVFHGLRMNPGSVIGAGVVEGKPVVMLPGQIVSTYAGFYLFLVPLMAKYGGLSVGAMLTVVRAKMVQDVRARPNAAFLRVRLRRVDGEFLATPVSGGSGRLATLVESNGYTIVPRGWGLKEGESVDVVLYGRHEFAHLAS